MSYSVSNVFRRLLIDCPNDVAVHKRMQLTNILYRLKMQLLFNICISSLQEGTPAMKIS